MGCIGKILGNRYEIIEEIGSGGMATVYKAKCKLLNRFVAIKVLRDEFANDSEFIKRFQVEAQSAASLSHPNIVSIYDVGYEDGMHYIVMELIEGRTLKEIIQEKGKLPWREAVQFASQIASGLNQAHQNHIVHRDIKPHNIIITKDGIAKVTDFGIAKAVSNSTINAFGSTIGSVHYFSPEHARGGYTDEKSDIYSLGVVLYEMCTGKLPFEGETPVAVALKHLQEEPKEPISICESLPQSINDIIIKAMRKDVSDRYKSAAEMHKDLQKVLSDPSIEVIKEVKTKEEFPTQRIPVLGIEKQEEKQLTLEKINKYKNEQDDEKMSKNKKITKSMAIVRAIFILAFGVLVFFGCMKFGEFISIQVLGAPKTVSVPNLIGYSLEEGTRLLEECGLELGTKTEEVNNEYPKGYIVWQEYAEKYNLKVGTPVNVRVSKGQKMVLVPNVLDYTSTTAAESAIKQKNLVYKEEGEYSNTFEEGKIIRQDPNVNEEVPEGSTVTVYISLGPSGDGLVKVPDIMGKTEEEARKILADANLLAEIFYPYTASKENGIVLSQTPEAGTYVSEMSEIIVAINKVESSTGISGDKNNNANGNENSNNGSDKKDEGDYITVNLAGKGTRENFVVRVTLEGQSVGKKEIYLKVHNRNEGSVKVPITYVKGAMLKVYIDDVLDSEQIL